MFFVLGAGKGVLWALLITACPSASNLSLHRRTGRFVLWADWAVRKGLNLSLCQNKLSMCSVCFMFCVLVCASVLLFTFLSTPRAIAYHSMKQTPFKLQMLIPWNFWKPLAGISVGVELLLTSHSGFIMMFGSDLSPEQVSLSTTSLHSRSWSHGIGDVNYLGSDTGEAIICSILVSSRLCSFCIMHYHHCLMHCIAWKALDICF